MPTQRFLKLKEEKKQAILEAAVHEFSRVPYSSASINQIIKEADISRGSFYTYFEDKDDLMRYMLRGFRDNCQERIFRTLKEQGGNPFGTALMLSDLSVVDQNHLFGIKGFLLQDESYGEFVHKLYEGIDRERYPVDEETLSYLVDMAMLIIIRAVTLYYKNVVDREKLLEVTKKEMLILEYGVCRNTGN